MGWEGDKGPPYKFGMGPPECLIRLWPWLLLIPLFWITICETGLPSPYSAICGTPYSSNT